MPSEPLAGPLAVAARDLKKKYRLFASPTERLKEALHPFRRQFHREFWALNGVTFELPKGQTLGILGANGSGKSTLLQVIAGIVYATAGTLEVNGRISALLELGAGFNPEFTGRDNVILNGAINGIPEKEMAQRMPEIEAFADIGTFFDQPVKTYSSGMFVRVAFAVAINVDPDILIIDEALAVGDARFQNKCYERLARFQRDGKTIILVTHDTAAVANHCDRALVMDHGKNVFDGPPAAAIDCYFNVLYPRRTHSAGQEATDPGRQQAATANQGRLGETDIFFDPEFWNPEVRDDRCPQHASYNPNETMIGNGLAEIIDYRLLSDTTPPRQDSFLPGCRLHLFVKVLLKQNIDKFTVGFGLKSVDGVEIYGTNTGSALLRSPVSVEAGVHYFEFNFEQRLNPGDYFIDIGVGEDDGSPVGSVIKVRRSVCHFVVEPDGPPRFIGIVDLATRFVHHRTAMSARAAAGLAERI